MIINPIPSTINVQDLLKKGEEIYQQELKSILEPGNNGKYVAIEAQSRKYFLGDTKEEAVAEAKKNFPDKIFVTRRIGEIEKIASYSQEFTPPSFSYDWVL
ncbi:MAG: hypothetical protein AAB600_02070 [Patescibacteria group bacterium]